MRRTFLRRVGYTEPSDLLIDINRDLLDGGDEDCGFVVALLALIQPAARRMVIRNGGQLSPFLIRPEGIEPIEVSGTLLGVVNEIEHPPYVRRLDPGDGLLVGSDGLITAIADSGTRLEEAGLHTLIQRHCHLAPEEMVGTLAREIHRFGKVTDDISLAVVRYTTTLSNP